MTYDLARAAATDAANRQARENGRTAWNQDDYALACRTLDALFPGSHPSKGVTP